MAPPEVFSASPAAGRSWPAALWRWWGSRRPGPDPADGLGGPVARFRNLCITREAGAGGGTLARMVGRRLDWKVYDHELIEAIAHGMQVPAEEVKALDELAPSSIQDWLLPLREEHYAPQEAYLDHLAKLVESIGRAGHSILVGRGAAWLLPRESTLRVLVVAPLKARAQRLAERLNVSPRTARRAARELDARSRRFVRVLHRANPADPHEHDLVLDTQSLGLTIAAEVLARAIEAGQPPPPLKPQLPAPEAEAFGDPRSPGAPR